MSEFNEPWRVFAFKYKTLDYPTIFDCDDEEVTRATEMSGIPIPFIPPDVLARIVACVNFCAGLDDDELQGEPLLHTLTYYRGWTWTPEDGTWKNAIPGNTAEPPCWIPSAARSLTAHATHDGTRPLLSALAIARPAE